MSSLSYLPSKDALLRSEAMQQAISRIGRTAVSYELDELLDELRVELSHPGTDNMSREAITRLLEDRLNQKVAARSRERIQRVINATGVVLHTNLGRAPLASEAIERVIEVASAYSNLEYDLTTGERGKRSSNVARLAMQIFGCESSTIVNNCAAAVLLTLNTIAEGGEVIISRGELIEIGGSFRLPDVIAKSGARLREVGTTNRTRITDYENAITDNTRVIMHAHPSNYRIVGFTEKPQLEALAELSRSSGIPLFVDAGSGCTFQLEGEPQIADTLNRGASIVSFSGDKLLGGPQAGIIVGEAKYVERIARNPLARALRVDKMTLAALESTLEIHSRGEAASKIPAHSSIRATKEELAHRVQRFAEKVSTISELQIEIVEAGSSVGGGCAPQVELPSMVLAVSSPNLSAEQIEMRLRASDPPVIARIAEGKVLVDLRCVRDSEESEVLDALKGMIETAPSGIE